MSRRPLKIAILGNDAASYVKPMAEGLQRMLSRNGVESTVFYDGLAALAALPESFPLYIRKNGPSGLRIGKRTLKYLLKETPALYRFFTRLRSYDAIVIVASIPTCFMTTFFPDDTLRWLFPKTPLVLYDLFYLPTRGPWAAWLKDGSPEHSILEGGHWGLERYDWYLCASVVSETPMPLGAHPYSRIGLDLDDGSLKPGDKSEFFALLDFEHAPDLRERALQIQACEESGTKYAVLNGRYSIEAIRKLYGKSTMFFLSMRESFGLPICEAQASGSFVCTPYSDWCPSHWIKPDLSRAGPGELSPNFIVYDNDKNKLIEEIARVKRSYNPAMVVETFHRNHPQLYFGDDTALGAFIDKLRNGTITSRAHTRYREIRGSGIFPSHNPTGSLSRRA